MLRAEFHPLLLVQFIGQIEVGLFLAIALLAKFHQRAELGDQIVESIFVGLSPVVTGLRGANQDFLLLHEADREWQFTDLFDDASLDGFSLLLVFIQNGQ
ncbi:hypothetical protein D3C77_474370 [compost metagenome]